MAERNITFTIPLETARVLTGAARYVAKKKRREAERKPFIPEPGHYNLNERCAELLEEAVDIMQAEIDEFDR